MSIVQRSKEWFALRGGKFTGSENYKLLTGGRRDMTREEEVEYKKTNPKGTRKTIDVEFGDVAMGYILKKAIEIAFGVNEEDKFVTFDMQRGIDLEPLAFRKFKELKSFDFIDVQPAEFFVYDGNAGASPDGLVGNDAVLEIKCPQSEKFFKLVKNGISEIASEYIVQMQTEMLATNSLRCHFFNYLIYNGREMWHEIILSRDEVMITILKDKITKAAKLRDEMVVELKNNIQFLMSNEIHHVTIVKNG